VNELRPKENGSKTMNLTTLFKLFRSPTAGWQELLATKPSMPRLFVFHVLPLASIPPLMIFFTAISADSTFLVGTLSPKKLILVGLILFIIQLMAVPMMALIIKQLGEVINIKPSFQSAFTLAAVAPTPFWLYALLLVLPNLLVLVTFGSLALMASFGLIYYGLPLVFDIKDKDNAAMYFGGIMIAGAIALAFLMLSTLVIMGSLQNLSF
jgi:hypothetical protein